ncbi:MAG: prepilin-type N-terminal cleavage/methylation domain-containing protein [Patescibacteria group bacterium]
MLSLKLFRGFTIVEIIVVVAVIGLLVILIVPSFSNSKVRTRDARRVNDIKTLAFALSQYYNDFGVYPLQLSSLMPQYLPAEPKDPLSDLSYFYSVVTRSSYASTDCSVYPAVKYHLGAPMEVGETTNKDLILDSDWAGAAGSSGAYVTCSNTGADFNGNATTILQQCVGAVCGGTVICNPDKCYDWTN